MNEKEIEIFANGRVQGVNFRNTVKKYADKLNLKGFVENKEDGSVQILLQGERTNLSNFLSLIQNSPGLAKIEKLSYNWKNISKNYPDFKVIKQGNFLLDQTKSFMNLGKSLLKLKKNPIPIHIAIIPDGNRRWAKKKGYEGSFGHYKAGSYENLESLFKEAQRLGVKYMSIWGFSTENWERSKEEQKAIFDLILRGVEKFKKDSQKNRIRFRHIGRKDRIPKDLAQELIILEKETEQYSDFNVQLCLDYGGRDEILRAINKAITLGEKNLTEEDFSQLLDTSDIPNPDLVIRTSGENRTSGFMPFQAAYSELYFSPLFFPDFTNQELKKAIDEFGIRQRRFGK